MKAGGRKKLAAVIACAGSMLLAFTSALSPMTFIAFAAVPSEFDKTAIEEDLKVFELEGYPKNEEEKHRLIDGGFMEYAYSENAELSGKYYGVYFYVYNPTEREVSERAGAHTVNMAVSYDAAGKPSDYDNLALTLLDETDNHRFLKFKLTDGAGAYARAKAYAQAHGGERRYDVAGVQLWFAGDQNATDSKAGKDISYTFRCTGYAAGCGADAEAESTYECNAEKLETVELSVKHTFYRTESSSLGKGHQNQVNTVYFNVPQELLGEYGKLQRIKAEWWEYKTKPIRVTSNPNVYALLEKFVGRTEFIGRFPSTMVETDLVLTEEDLALLAADASFIIPVLIPAINSGVFYIFPTKDWCDIGQYDPAADIEESGGVSSTALERYIFNYDKSYASGVLDCKEQKISADLFEEDIDDSRKIDNERGKIQKGYSYYDFDIDEDIQTIITWKDKQPTWWDNFLQFGLWDTIWGNVPNDSGRTFAPIYTVKEEDLRGTEHEIAERLMIQVSDVEKLKIQYEQSGKDTLILFRFATSDYITGLHEIYQMYYARESVFLNFDIIQLTFKRGDKLKVIPVVSNPIDIISPITPPPVYSNGIPWWVWCAAAGVILTLGLVITIMAEKEARK